MPTPAPIPALAPVDRPLEDVLSETTPGLAELVALELELELELVEVEVEVDVLVVEDDVVVAVAMACSWFGLGILGTTSVVGLLHVGLEPVESAPQHSH